MAQLVHPLLSQALAAHRAGAIERAESLYRQILIDSPDAPDPHHLLGILCLTRGDVAAAILSITRAVTLAGNRTPTAFHQNLAKAHFAAGDNAAAIHAFDAAIASRPDDPDLLSEAAAAHIAVNHVTTALQLTEKALARDASHGGALVNRGVALQLQGDLAGAAEAFNRALLANASLSDAWLGLGTVLRQGGDHEGALAAFIRAKAVAPARTEPVLEMVRTLVHVQRYAEAAATLEAAFASNSPPELLREYAVCLFHLNRLDDAAHCLARAIALRPNFADAHYSLGVVEGARSGPHASLPHYQRAVASAPDFPEALVNLADALRSTGQTEAALPLARRAVDLRPTNSLMHSALLYGMHYSARVDRASLLAEHRRWSARHVEPLLSAANGHDNQPQPHRRLRVGYVSPDFYYHPAARYVLPLLKHHNHASFEIFLYASNAKEDYVTAQCRSLADHYRPVRRLSDEQLAQTIRDDGIDLLIDLSLHMAENRQLVFARKPAPVQLSLIGYPSTTGNPAIDYRLSDHFLEPAGQPELAGPEKIARIAAPFTFWCFDAHDDDVPARLPPALHNGYLTFGSLNNPAKTSDLALDHWCSILRAVPTSRLLLLAHNPPDADLLSRFGAQGVYSDRIRFSPRVGRRDYLRLYDQIDVCLDPYPYTGHSTSFDALYMGVPLLTHQPPPDALPVSKAGVSALNALKLTEWIAPSADALPAHALALTGDFSALAAVSASLRERMRASPLMDAPGYTAAIEAIYRSAWQAWCMRS